MAKAVLAKRVSKRRRLAPTERRRALIATGFELLGRRNYQEVEVEDIAAAAGVSTGLLYHYFPSKRDFYVPVVREAADRLLAVTDIDPELPRRRRLAATMEAYVEYLQQYPAGFAAVHRGAIGADPAVRAIVEDYKRVQLERVLRDLGLEPGEHPALELAVRGWQAFVVEVSLEWLDSRQLSPRELRDLFVEAMRRSAAAAG